MCRNVCHKIESSSMPHKKNLILTLHESRGNGFVSQHVSEEWVDTLDCGGLWHVTDEVFFVILKRRFYSISQLRHSNQPMN